MRFKNIFLDFDGTVSKSGPGLFNALAYMFEKMSIPAPGDAVLKKYIGPPVKHVLQEHGITGEECDRAYAAFREYYEHKGIFEMELYEGVRDMLQALYKSEAAVHLATGKRGHQAVRALEFLHIGEYFDNVFGAEADKNIIEKKDILRRAIELLGAYPEDSVMVGDRAMDIEGGREHGFATLGVLYGYGDEEEIINAQPDFIAKDPAELKSILLG